MTLRRVKNVRRSIGRRSDCELSVRTMNVCNELGINTARELFATSEEALKRAPGFHRNVLADIAGWFEESGIVWPPK